MKYDIKDRVIQPSTPHVYVRNMLYANGKRKPLNRLLKKGPQLYSKLVERFGEEKLLNMATQLTIKQTKIKQDYVWELASETKREPMQFTRLSE